MEKKIADLIPDAKKNLDDLLGNAAIKKNCWFLKLSSDGLPEIWEQLTLDREENRKRISQKVKESKVFQWDLCLVFIGDLEWRGKKQLMAHAYFFRSDYDDGLICGSHIRQKFFSNSFAKTGGFLIQGGCKNEWRIAATTV